MVFDMNIIINGKHWGATDHEAPSVPTPMQSLPSLTPVSEWSSWCPLTYSPCVSGDIQRGRGLITGTKSEQKQGNKKLQTVQQ